MTQAVEWRTLAEPNRDVFLAENLFWLQQTAFPGARERPEHLPWAEVEQIDFDRPPAMYPPLG